MRSSVGRLAVAGALAVCGAVVPSSHASSAGRLVVTTATTPASTASYTDLIVSRATSLNLGAWTATSLTRTPPTYTGFFVANRDAGSADGEVGSLRVAGFNRSGFLPAPVPLGFDVLRTDPEDAVRVLPPGRYRIYVLTDRPMRLTIPTPGDRAVRTLTANRRTPATVVQQALSPLPAPGVPGAVMADLPLKVGSRDMTVFAMRLFSDRVAITDAVEGEQCVVPEQTPACPYDDPGMHYGTEEVHPGAGGLGARVSFLDSVFYRPGMVGRGSRVAHLRHAGTQRSIAAYGFALTVTVAA